MHSSRIFRPFPHVGQGRAIRGGRNSLPDELSENVRRDKPDKAPRGPDGALRIPLVPGQVQDVGHQTTMQIEKNFRQTRIITVSNPGEN